MIEFSKTSQRVRRGVDHRHSKSGLVCEFDFVIQKINDAYI